MKENRGLALVSSMNEFWRSKSSLLAAFLVCSFYLLNLSFCWSLNDEGLVLLKFKEKIVSDPRGALSNWIEGVGIESPCSWSGVGCSEGYVVVLNLKDFCLGGTLSSDIGNLIHLKFIILRNNSFSGVIPKEIENLKELVVLDLGYNNFSGQLPHHLGNIFSTVTLLLDNNEVLGSIQETDVLQEQSEVQEEDVLSRPEHTLYHNGQVIAWNSADTRDVAGRKLLEETLGPRRPTPFGYPRDHPESNFPPPLAPSPSPDQPPSPSPESSVPSSSPPVNDTSPPSLLTPAKSPAAKISRTNRKLAISGAIVGPILLLFFISGIIFCKSGKVATVKPWATGLSGQLQRAFVTGVPKLKRSELEAACEDFSNVIGSSSVCTLYKGTLSSGVEIAVASIAVASAKDWSSNLKAQFRKKIETLSKVNHKNFVSLLGFCEEEEPFTRMMVFEYAPNGTLFEHLHIREAEHLDWATRLRIAMGMAYCLEHMHQLAPPLAHRDLTSSTVYLTEDYAGKVSDFVFWDETERQTDLQSNVYSFGVVLFEMISGKLPYSTGNDPLQDWASDYLKGTQTLREMVDPTLTTYREDQLNLIGSVIKACVDPNPRVRPSMREVCGWLREITGIGPDGAIPKLSPLWWAELEILTTEVN